MAAAARLSAGCPAGPGWVAPGRLLHQDAPRPAAGGLATRPGAARTGLPGLCKRGPCWAACRYLAWQGSMRGPRAGCLPCPALLCATGACGLPLTWKAMAVRVATSMCPLKMRSLQPPPARVRVLNQAAKPGLAAAVGRRKGARNWRGPHSGTNSGAGAGAGAGNQQWQPHQVSEQGQGGAGCPRERGEAPGRVHVGEDRRAHSKHKRWDLGEKRVPPSPFAPVPVVATVVGQAGDSQGRGGLVAATSRGGPPAGRWSLSRAHSAIWSWAYGRWNWAAQGEGWSGATKRWAAHLQFFFI